jgi:hypothetical protein
MKNDVMADRRVAPRYPLILIAEIVDISGAKMMARTSDVSRTGCYLDTLRPALKGAQIQLKLMRGEEVLLTQAKVTYASPGLGMGVQFSGEMTESQLLILDRWLTDAARAM